MCRDLTYLNWQTLTHVYWSIAYQRVKHTVVDKFFHIHVFAADVERRKAFDNPPAVVHRLLLRNAGRSWPCRKRRQRLIKVRSFWDWQVIFINDIVIFWFIVHFCSTLASTWLCASICTESFEELLHGLSAWSMRAVRSLGLTVASSVFACAFVKNCVFRFARWKVYVTIYIAFVFW